MRETESIAKDEAASAVGGTKLKRDFELEDDESLIALMGRDLEDLWSAR
jgi:hypothetical protein